MSKSTKIEKNKMANKFDSQKRVKFSNKLKELINNSKVKGTIKGIDT